ncbi:MAG: hypothetical protein ICV63_02060 [Coleofasciculus sp. Co-bin14]|nr:hypothetical protein [Coleofasciculus sp. Co-bin14]
MSQSNAIPDIVSGVLLVFGLNILVMFLVFTIPFIGLVQLFYVVPIAIRRRNRQQWESMKGVIIGAVITVLLNGGCWLWFLGNFR